MMKLVLFTQYAGSSMDALSDAVQSAEGGGNLLTLHTDKAISRMSKI